MNLLSRRRSYMMAHAAASALKRRRGCVVGHEAAAAPLGEEAV